MDDGLTTADYQQLLRRGSVMRRLAAPQHEGWRRAMRAKARADGLRIRTWSRADQSEVWAVLRDWSLTPDEHEELLRRLSWRDD